MPPAAEATGVVKYQFQINDEKWQEWKRTVPRDKSLEDRIIELIEADTEGRVSESTPAPPETDDVQDDVEPVTAGETTDTERKAEVYDDLAEESAAGDVGDVEEHDAGDVQDDVEAFVERVSDTWEDTEERLASRRAAAEVVLQHALDTGDAVGKSSDVVEGVRERFPVEGQNEETYWRKNIRPVLKEAGEYSQAHHGYVVEALDS